MIRLAVAGVRHPHIDTIIAEASMRDDVELVAISERDPAARAVYAAREQVRTHADHAHMLATEEIDVLGVGAINAERGEIIAGALDAGLDVISDKPMCTSLADLDTIDSARRRSSGQLSLALEKRFYPATVAAHRLLTSGEIGTLTVIAASAPHKLTRARRPDWMFDPAQYGGILNDLMIHDVDLMLWFTGAESGRLRAYSGGPDDLPDRAVVALQTAGGALATLEAHWMSPEAAPFHGDYRMRLVGTEGTAEMWWKDEVLTVATHLRPPHEEPLPAGKRPAEDFFDAVATGTVPLVDGAAAVAATRVTLLAQESADRDTELAWDVSDLSARDQVSR